MEPWRRLDRADADEARRQLAACCGSTRWVERMLARRPFRSRIDLLTAAREEWFALEPRDWREAFTQHPRIGDRHALAARFPTTHALSAREQAGVDEAPASVLDALAAANGAYEERFGHTFIVCATGKSASEMLALLRERLQNEPARELGVAAEEQAKITAIRLERGVA